MKEIIIKRMQFTNFKGLRDVAVDFDRHLSTINGRNGSGKTTLFDGFTWVLFGKDSQGRAKFDIKTLDDKGVAIPRIPHEVAVWLSVDGEDVCLRRRFTEVWSKKRGSAVEEFNGHEEQRLYNDVPCSVKDWQEKIADICSEQVFTFITSPHFFTSQKTDVQRKMLFRMAGDVSDADIARGNVEFTRLLGMLTGKTLEEFKREIGAKKKRIKEELQGLPGRIEERRREEAVEVDTEAVNKELTEKREALAEIDRQLTDATRAYLGVDEARQEKAAMLSQMRSKRIQAETEVKYRATEKYRQNARERERLTHDIADIQSRINYLAAEVQGAERDLAAKQELRKGLLAEWQEVKGRTPKIDEGSFICPACGRRYEVEEIEAKRDEIIAKHNLCVANDLADNVRRGKANKAAMEKLTAYIDKCRQEQEAKAVELNQAKDRLTLLVQVQKPDEEAAVAASPEIRAMREAEARVEQELAQAPTTAPDTSDLMQGKQVLAAAIDELKLSLYKAEQSDKNQARIKELETQYQSQSQELADLEGLEFTMAAFAKAKVNAVEERINAMFTLVRFKMYEQQINGGERETCEATVDGVPYSSLNNAMQINAGLDIINAICRTEGVTAPIFVDNAESVLQLIPMQSQVVRLVVTDTELTSENTQKTLFN